MTDHRTSIALLPFDPLCRGTYLGTNKLAENYMSDFSLMGFVVDRFSEACSILRSAGFQLTQQSGGAEIAIDSPVRIPQIRALFTGHNIGCDYSDIADTLYQA